VPELRDLSGKGFCCCGARPRMRAQECRCLLTQEAPLSMGRPPLRPVLCAESGSRRCADTSSLPSAPSLGPALPAESPPFPQSALRAPTPAEQSVISTFDTPQGYSGIASNSGSDKKRRVGEKNRKESKRTREATNLPKRREANRNWKQSVWKRDAQDCATRPRSSITLESSVPGMPTAPPVMWIRVPCRASSAQLQSAPHRELTSRGTGECPVERPPQQEGAGSQAQPSYSR